MAERQTINLSSDEDLTSVRERLKRVNARHITLIVPPRTLLRSYMGWRVLREDAYALNKDILVISSDRQIRAMVKETGFRVDAPQTSSSERSHSSKFGRTRSSTPAPTSTRKEARGSVRTQRSTESPPASKHFKKPTMATHDPYIDDLGTGGPTAPLSSTFGASNNYYGSDYNNSSGTSSSLHPLTPAPENVDVDYEILSRDHKQAQSIWEAANFQSQNQDTLVSPEPPVTQVPETPFQPHSFNESNIAYSNNGLLDADTALPPLETEQPDNVSSIADYSTSDRFAKEDVNPKDKETASELIDDGDLGDIVQYSSPSYSVEDPYDEVEDANDEDDDTLEASHSSHFLDNFSRSGYLDREGRPLSVTVKGNEGSTQQAFNQTTRNLPNRLRKQSRAGSLPATISNEPQSIAMPTPGKVSPGSAPSRPRKGHRPKQPKSSLIRPVRVPRRRKSQGSRSGAIFFLVVVLVLIIIGILGYVVPSANVTVILASTTSKSLAMTYTAAATSPLDSSRHTLPAELLTYNTSVQGNGQATGTTTVGTVPARGTETFTNNGSQPVHIPTGTVIETTNNVQFATIADALLLTGSNYTSIIPIQAKVPGTNGNVGANSITVMPSSSTSMLQQINNGEQIKLSITNTSATFGGGTGTAIAVSKNDVSREQAALTTTLQNRINDFLHRQVHTGDQVGKPASKETPLVTPSVGTIVNNGSFTMHINLHMTVLVVRANKIQEAATQMINAMLKQQKPGYALVPQQKLLITGMKNIPASDSKSLKLSFSAQGQIAPQISEDTIRAATSGKSINDARAALLNRHGGFTQIKQVMITIFPSVFPRVPYMQQHITIHFLTVPSTSTPTPTPKKTK